MKHLSRTILISLFLLMTFGSASAQERIAIGNTVESTARGVPVEYTITLRSGQGIIVNAMSEDFDTYLELRDANGVILSEDDDSGEGFNSRVAFTAPADGDFVLHLRGLGAGPNGAFTMSVAEFTITPLTLNSPVTMEPDGANPLFFSFNNEKAGSTVNISAISAADEDTRMALNAPDGTEIANDDDSGSGTNPYLRQLILPDTGIYLLEVSPFSDNVLTGDLTVTIEGAELLAISADFQSVTLDDEVGSQIFRFNASPNTTYRLMVNDLPEFSFVSINISDSDNAFLSSMNVNGATRVVMEFVVPNEGLASVEFTSSQASFETAIMPLEG